MKRSEGVLACVAMLAIAGCGDDATGVQFPNIDAETAMLYCIRGTAVPTETVSGTITDDDCHTGITDDGFWEIWRVRVKASGSVTFLATSSSFDTYLELFRIDDINDIENSVVFLAEDDDSGPGLNAQLSYQLQPNVEYAIMVSGYDDSETGSYSLSMTAN